MGSLDDSKSEPSVPDPLFSKQNASYHILVIEDEDLLRDAICNSLMEDGYKVSQAASAEEALPILKSKAVDLIVLDLLLPGRDGFDFIRDLRSWPKTKRIPIIVVTARDTISHRVMGLDLGAGDYMTKPFALAELKARIRAHLRQAKESSRVANRPGVVLEFSALWLEKARKAVWLKNDEGTWNRIFLTIREFDILWFLAENKGAPKTRAEILIATLPEEEGEEEEEEEGEIIAENKVDVHIHRLRRKIGPLWIQTVYRAGVRFVDPHE